MTPPPTPQQVTHFVPAPPPEPAPPETGYRKVHQLSPGWVQQESGIVDVPVQQPETKELVIKGGSEMDRVNSLIRRYTTLNPVTGNEAATMLLKDMVIDKINRTVTVQNLPVDLTGKEFDLLLFLASNKGRVFTKKQLYTQVWTEEYDFDDNNLMAFISKLRKKIEPNPEQPFYIQTVRGVGYRFNKEA
jgi:hypothetical protein